ncbi:MAG: hypothetical protein N3D74_03820 [Caldisericia bacterium]|nr:hypothetical protein [Caldisericia bacterium]
MLKEKFNEFIKLIFGKSKNYYKDKFFKNFLDNLIEKLKTNKTKKLKINCIHKDFIRENLRNPY